MVIPFFCKERMPLKECMRKIRKIIRKICSILINKCMLCQEQMIEIQKEAYIIYLILSLLYQ